MTPPTIAIVGAGPCGLTLARLLERQGLDYAVYERDLSAQTNRTGGSLDIQGETGQSALRECGLFDDFTQKARYDDTAFVITDRQGEKLFEIGQGRDAPEIDRAELRQILLDSVPEHKIKWGHVLRRATPGDDGTPVLEFANGVTLSGSKLVVGADGAWSKVRPMVTQATPRYTGKSIIVSSVGHGSPLHEKVARELKVGSRLSIGSGKFIMNQRQGDGSYRVSFGVQAPEGDFGRYGTVDVQDVEATRHVLLSQFYADWSEEQKDLLRHSTRFRAWPLHSLSPEDMGWQHVRRVTLAGDAAHLSYPGGEGVNLAMTDALKLASKIAEHGIDNMERAVQEYEEDMLSRAVAAIRQSRAMERVMYGDDPQAFIELISS